MIFDLSLSEAQYVFHTLVESQGIWMADFIKEIIGENLKLVRINMDNKLAIEHARTLHSIDGQSISKYAIIMCKNVLKMIRLKFSM